MIHDISLISSTASLPSPFFPDLIIFCPATVPASREVLWSPVHLTLVGEIMPLRLKTLLKLLVAFRVKYMRPWRGGQGFSQFHPCLSLQAHFLPLCRRCSGHSKWYAMSSPASAFALTPAWCLSIPHPTAQSLKCLWSVHVPHPAVWLGNPSSGLPSLLVYLCRHLCIIHKTLGLWQPLWM